MRTDPAFLLMKHYIRQMRKLYVHAKDYDREYKDFKEDVREWIRLSRRIGASKVLELGVGTGRIAIPLAREKIEVTGIDISSQMIELARAKRRVEKRSFPRILGLSLTKGDMTNFSLNERFDLIFIALNTFFHLLPEHQREPCFECVREHLRPGGVFGIGIFNIEEKIRRGEFGEINEKFPPVLTIDKKIGNILYERWDQDIYNRKTQILECHRKTRKFFVSKKVRWRTLKRSYVKEFLLYVLPPKEMERTLSKDFVIDFQLSRLDPGAENHYWVCRPRN